MSFPSRILRHVPVSFARRFAQQPGVWQKEVYAPGIEEYRRIAKNGRARIVWDDPCWESSFRVSMNGIQVEEYVDTSYCLKLQTAESIYVWSQFTLEHPDLRHVWNSYPFVTN